MLMSMTGFGKAVVETTEYKVSAEIKSLNSKQLDLAVRLPQSVREHEADVRSAVAHALERGKVDVTISVESTAGEVPARVNTNVLAQYRTQITEACAALGLPEPADWWSVLLRMPEVMHAETQQACGEGVAEALKAAVDQSLAGVREHRRAEGAELEKFFAARIEGIRGLLAQVPQYEQERIERIRARITDGLAKITVADYDRGRLEQEMIFYIEKLDINEEKQRLTKHLDYFLETMSASNGGQGKKLGFISQEMGREINTMGSKSNHAEMQRLVVRMKDLLEQIKEQVLNVM